MAQARRTRRTTTAGKPIVKAEPTVETVTPPLAVRTPAPGTVTPPPETPIVDASVDPVASTASDVTGPAEGNTTAPTPPVVGVAGAATDGVPETGLPPNDAGLPDPVPNTPSDDDPESAGAAAVEAHITDLEELNQTAFRQYWLKYLAELGIATPHGHILFPQEPLTYKGNKLRGNVVEVAEDVYRMVIPFRSRRATFTLVARAGSIVPKTMFVPKAEYEAAVGDLYGQIELAD